MPIGGRSSVRPRFYRDERRTILDAHPKIEVVGETGTEVESIARAPELQPDVILIDIKMPGVNARYPGHASHRPDGSAYRLTTMCDALEDLLDEHALANLASAA